MSRKTHFRTPISACQSQGDGGTALLNLCALLAGIVFMAQNMEPSPCLLSCSL